MEFDAPVDAAILNLAVGKPGTKPLTVDLVVADVTVEQLAGP